MLWGKIALCLITAAVAFAQVNDIEQRLRRALAGGGEGERAVLDLSNKDFDSVDRMLAGEPASDDVARSELVALRGAVAFLQGRMNAAAADFSNAAKLAPLSDADTFTEAMALVSLGDKAAGRRLLEQLAHRSPERPIYVYWLGKLDYDDHRYEEADEELRRSLALDPRSARAWDSLGLTFDMQGHADQARTAFEKAATLNREQPHPSPWPPHDLGYWLFRMNQIQDAEAALRESLRYDPAFAQGHYHLGRTLEKEGRDSEAITEYLTAVRSDTVSADACYALGLLYRKLHRDSEAADMFAEYRKRRQALP